jgi:hypothetical protein
MRIVLLALVTLLAPAAASYGAEDPFKLIKLEQDVRNLEREVRTLAREVGALRAQLGRGPSRTAPAPRPGEAPAAESTAWLRAAQWDRVRSGMSELEVIELLGPPTSLRREDGKHLMLYALEIDSSSFLSGSVALQDHAVVEVHKPVLK